MIFIIYTSYFIARVHSPLKIGERAEGEDACVQTADIFL